MNYPKPIKISTIRSDDSPNGAVTTVAFNAKKFEEFARANPNQAFRVELEDGKLFPFPISTASYWEARDSI